MSVVHIMPLDGNVKAWTDNSRTLCERTYRQLSEDPEAHVTADPGNATCVPCLRADEQLVFHLLCLGQTACGITEPTPEQKHDIAACDPDKVNCSACINTPVFERVRDFFAGLAHA